VQNRVPKITNTCRTRLAAKVNMQQAMKHIFDFYAATSPKRAIS